MYWREVECCYTKAWPFISMFELVLSEKFTDIRLWPAHQPLSCPCFSINVDPIVYLHEFTFTCSCAMCPCGLDVYLRCDTKNGKNSRRFMSQWHLSHHNARGCDNRSWGIKSAWMAWTNLLFNSLINASSFSLIGLSGTSFGRAH